MSPTLKNDSPWWKQNYEQLILLVVITALVVSAALLVMQLKEERMQQGQTVWTLPAGQQARADVLDVDDMQNRLAKLGEKVALEQYRTRMLVSELRVNCINCNKPIPLQAMVCGFCGHKQPEPRDDNIQDDDADGMPNQWEMDHGLNPNDPDDAHFDADGDGFTNIEEFRGETDPTNPESYPPLTAKLRLLGTMAEPFVLRFTGVQRLVEGGEPRFQLNLRTLNRTYFPSLGDVIDDPGNNVRGIKVQEFQPDAPEGPTLILLKDGERIPLVKGKAINESELVANIAFLIDRSRYVVRLNDVIDLRAKKYNVVDIKRQRVLLRDSETGEESQVNPITQSELDSLRGVDRTMMDADGTMMPDGIEPSVGAPPPRAGASGTFR